MESIEITVNSGQIELIKKMTAGTRNIPNPSEIMVASALFSNEGEDPNLVQLVADIAESDPDYNPDVVGVLTGVYEDLEAVYGKPKRKAMSPALYFALNAQCAYFGINAVINRFSGNETNAAYYCFMATAFGGFATAMNIYSQGAELRELQKDAKDHCPPIYSTSKVVDAYAQGYNDAIIHTQLEGRIQSTENIIDIFTEIFGENVPFSDVVDTVVDKESVNEDIVEDPFRIAIRVALIVQKSRNRELTPGEIQILQTSKQKMINYGFKREMFCGAGVDIIDSMEEILGKQDNKGNVVDV